MAKDGFTTESVTAAEVEQWKLQKAYEKEFWAKLKELTDNLLLKVGDRNPVVGSMRRIMHRNNV